MPQELSEANCHAAIRNSCSKILFSDVSIILFTDEKDIYSAHRMNDLQ